MLLFNSLNSLYYIYHTLFIHSVPGYFSYYTYFLSTFVIWKKKIFNNLEHNHLIFFKLLILFYVLQIMNFFFPNVQI